MAQRDGAGDGRASPTSGRPRRERRDQARRSLLDAARQLLEDKPWAHITVDDLTSAAGLSRTAFYQHFVDRQEVLLTLLDELDHEVDSLGDQWLRGGDDPVAEHRVGLSDIVDHFAVNGRLLQAVRDSAGFEDSVTPAYEAHLAHVIRLTADALRRDVANGHCTVEDPDQLADALTRMNEAYLLGCFGRVPFTDREVASTTLHRIWTRAIYPGRGR